MKTQYIILLFSASLGTLIASSDFDLNSRTEIIEYLEKDQNDLRERLTHPESNEISICASLWLAIMNNHQPTVELILQCPLDIFIEWTDHMGRTPLFLACLYGHENIAKLLIEHGANVNTKEYRRQLSALTVACLGGYTNIADLLLKNGALINHIYESGGTEIATIVYALKTDMVKYLIKAGADINLPQSITPLMAAFETGNRDLVDFLLKNKANVKATDAMGRSIIFYAAYSKSIEMVEYAIKLGCNVNSKDYQGLTPIYASLQKKNRNIEVFKMLIKHGADVNYTPSYGPYKGVSLLSMAASKDGQIAETLLKCNARVTNTEYPYYSELCSALSNGTDTKPVIKKIIKLILENSPTNAIDLAKRVATNELILQSSDDSPLHLDILRETMLEMGLIDSSSVESKWLKGLKYCALIVSAAALGWHVGSALKPVKSDLIHRI